MARDQGFATVAMPAANAAEALGDSVGASVDGLHRVLSRSWHVAGGRSRGNGQHPDLPNMLDPSPNLGLAHDSSST